MLVYRNYHTVLPNSGDIEFSHFIHEGIHIFGKLILVASPTTDRRYSFCISVNASPGFFHP